MRRRILLPRGPLPTLTPFLPAVLGHDSAQAIDVGLCQFVTELVQLLPRVPLRADELARDTVALLRGEVNAKARAKLERRRAFFRPLFVFAKNSFPTFPGPAAST